MAMQGIYPVRSEKNVVQVYVISYVRMILLNLCSRCLPNCQLPRVTLRVLSFSVVIYFLSGVEVTDAIYLA